MQDENPARDREYMQRAIDLALRGIGFVSPNPPVGCVLVRDGQVLGEGWHLRFGGGHAEVRAIVAARRRGKSVRGATAYVTLEPCNFTGKTGPCTEALTEAGIARVVIGALDPNPRVAGGGIERLRRAGVRVRAGIAAAEAEQLVAPLAAHFGQRLPFVVAKWAQSADGMIGRIGARGPEPVALTRRLALEHAHRVRTRVDAVLIGRGTALADDPRLSVRRAPLRRRPLRVVVDGELRLRLGSRLARGARESATRVYCSETASSVKAAQLESRGVEVCRVEEESGGGLVLRDVLADLGRRGVTSVLVEGGSTLLRSCFAARVVDECHVYLSTREIGAAGIAAPFGRLTSQGVGAYFGGGALRGGLSMVPVGADTLLVASRVTGAAPFARAAGLPATPLATWQI